MLGSGGAGSVSADRQPGSRTALPRDAGPSSPTRSNWLRRVLTIVTAVTFGALSAFWGLVLAFAIWDRGGHGVEVASQSALLLPIAATGTAGSMVCLVVALWAGTHRRRRPWAVGAWVMALGLLVVLHVYWHLESTHALAYRTPLATAAGSAKPGGVHSAPVPLRNVEPPLPAPSVHASSAAPSAHGSPPLDPELKRCCRWFDPYNTGEIVEGPLRYAPIEGKCLALYKQGMTLAEAEPQIRKWAGAGMPGVCQLSWLEKHRKPDP